MRGRVGYHATARMADRAAVIELRRFCAVIHAASLLLCRRGRVVTGPDSLAERRAVKPSTAASEGAAGNSTTARGSCPRPSTPGVTATNGPPGRSALSHGTCRVRHATNPVRAQATGWVLLARPFNSMNRKRPVPATRPRLRGPSAGCLRGGGDFRGSVGARPSVRRPPATREVWPGGACWLACPNYLAV